MLPAVGGGFTGVADILFFLLFLSCVFTKSPGCGPGWSELVVMYILLRLVVVIEVTTPNLFCHFVNESCSNFPNR